MANFIKRITLYFSFASLLITSYVFIQPILTQNSPNDYSRHKLIIKTLNDQKYNPEILVFGDSRTMFGVNAKTISKNLPNNPSALNLASVGQSLQEGSYFFSSIPTGVRKVVQCIEYGALSNKRTALNTYKALSMILNGYRIDSTTKKIIQNTHPYFDKPLYQVYFESRTSNKSMIHNFIRPILDDEVFENSLYHDLYFPHIYTTDRHPQYPFYDPESECNYDSILTANSTISLVKRINKYFTKVGIDYYLVLMPVNLEICKIDSNLHRNYITDLKSELKNIQIIDLSHSLKELDFYDTIHPNKKGAEKISRILALRIKSYSK